MLTPPPGSAERRVLLDLNNRHSVELSSLDMDGLDALLDTAWHVAAAPDGSAFLIAFDQNSAYASPNFLWFRMRYDRFVYVDRIVVDPAARGLGIASSMYRDLIGRASDCGHTLLCCEVNVMPPNEMSSRFHAAFGFREVGRAVLSHRGKTVSYLVRDIAPGQPAAE